MENPETLFVSGKTVVYREEISLEKFKNLPPQLTIVLKNDKPYRAGSKYIFQEMDDYDCKAYMIDLIIDGPTAYIKEDEVGLLLNEIGFRATKP